MASINIDNIGELKQAEPRPRNVKPQPMPYLQMLAKTSSFKANAANNLDGTPRSGRSDKPERIVPTPSKNATLNSAGIVGLINPFQDESEDNSEKPAVESLPVSNVYIGGQEDPDPYKTTVQMLQKGEKSKLLKRGVSAKKGFVVIEPEKMVNPLTGQLIGNYGTWAKDMARKKAESTQSNPETDESDEDPLIRKLKFNFASHGARSIIGLSRKFRIMDDDNSKFLSPEEFRKAMVETGLNFKSDDIHCLFNLFDIHNHGFVSYEDFLDALSPSLSKRRKMLVNMAYDVLDRDGSGLVDINDFAMAYDMSKHPDILSGKKTRENVLMELMAVFDVVDDGVIGRSEFEHYYRHLGASIEDDDYFELMIRNAWHISGGEGWAANSSGNGLAPRGVDKEAILAKVKSLTLTAGTSAPAAVSAPPLTLSSSRRLGSGRNGMPAGGANIKSISPQLEYEENVMALARKLKKQLVGDDGSGLISLQRKFRAADEDDSGSLDLREFRNGLMKCTTGFESKDFDVLFDLFDGDQSGAVTYEEFMDIIRGPVSARRRAMVNFAFDALDPSKRGLLDPITVIRTYDPTRHPDVLSGAKSAEEQKQEFLDGFDVGGQVEGAVTREEFQNYYGNVGVSITSDSFFDVMMTNVWGLDATAVGGIAAQFGATGRPGTAGGSGRNAGPGAVSAAGPAGWTSGRVTGRGGAGGSSRSGGSGGGSGAAVSIAPPSLMNQMLGVKPTKLTPPVEAPSAVAAAAAASLPPPRSDEEIALAGPTAPNTGAPLAGTGLTARTLSGRPQSARLTGPRPPVQIPVGKPQAPASAEPSPGVKMLLTKLKADIQSRGLFGYNELQRIFRAMDADDSKSLSLSEFKSAMKELKVNCTDAEMRWLFEYFDADNGGAIDFEEFIGKLRDPLSAARQRLVDLAFAKLDQEGTGQVTGQVIATSYDTTRHPEVLAQRMSTKGAYKEFLESFDMGGEVEGHCTLKEFNNYYSNIGATMSNDEYFELLVRNTWRLGARVAFSTPSVGQPQQQQQQQQPLPSPGNASGSGLVSKLRGEVSGGDIGPILEDMKALQNQAAQKFQQQNYAKCIQLFEQILSMMRVQSIPATHPEFVKTEKSIAVCKSKCGMR